VVAYIYFDDEPGPSLSREVAQRPWTDPAEGNGRRTGRLVDPSPGGKTASLLIPHDADPSDDPHTDLPSDPQPPEVTLPPSVQVKNEPVGLVD
jgi:hypothetical protein